MVLRRGIETKEEKKEEVVEVKEEKGNPVMTEAKEINKERNRILEEEKVLQERKEKFAAEELASGRAQAGTETKEQTQDEKDEEAAKMFMQDDE